MFDRGHHLVFRGAVARQLVRDHHTRHAGLPLQQLAKQTLGGLLVAPALDQNVEHEAILVDRPPQPVLRSPDHQTHLASRAGESHPHALPEPYVTLSGHTAPDVRPFPCGMENGFAFHRAPPATGWLWVAAEHCSPFGPVPLQNLPPSYELLRPCAPHQYSDPCGLSRLDVSLCIGATGSHVPYE